MANGKARWMGAKGFSLSHMLKSLTLKTQMTTSDRYCPPCCCLVLPVIVSFEVGSTLPCKSQRAAGPLPTHWWSPAHLECLQRLPLGICIIVMLSKSSWFLEFFWIINWKYWRKHTSRENWTQKGSSFSSLPCLYLRLTIVLAIESVSLLMVHSEG